MIWLVAVLGLLLGSGGCCTVASVLFAGANNDFVRLTATLVILSFPELPQFHRVRIHKIQQDLPKCQTSSPSILSRRMISG